MRFRLGVPLAWLAGFLAVGLPYWSIPYGGVTLPNALPTLGLLVVGASALFLVASNRLSLGMSTGILATTVPAAVLARVIVEVAGDPTSLNLWPFELVIAGVSGVLVAGAGGRYRRPGAPAQRLNARLGYALGGLSRGGPGSLGRWVTSPWVQNRTQCTLSDRIRGTGLGGAGETGEGVGEPGAP